MYTVKESKPNTWEIRDKPRWGSSYVTIRVSRNEYEPENSYVEAQGLDYVPLYPDNLGAVITTLLLANTRLNQVVNDLKAGSAARADNHHRQVEVDF